MFRGLTFVPMRRDPRFRPDDRDRSCTGAPRSARPSRRCSPARSTASACSSGPSAWPEPKPRSGLLTSPTTLSASSGSKPGRWWPETTSGWALQPVPEHRQTARMRRRASSRSWTMRASAERGSTGMGDPRVSLESCPSGMQGSRASHAISKTRRAPETMNRACCTIAQAIPSENASRLSRLRPMFRDCFVTFSGRTPARRRAHVGSWGSG
jgi:hypothetical protein